MNTHDVLAAVGIVGTDTPERTALEVPIAIPERTLEREHPISASSLYHYLREHLHRKSPELEAAVKTLCEERLIEGYPCGGDHNVRLTEAGVKRYDTWRYEKK